MAASSKQVVSWSDKTYKIRDLIRSQDYDLPLMVKVDEGIYNISESESFSQDDLIKLDLVKSIPKVVACRVDHTGRTSGWSNVRVDEHGYLEKSEDLTIPLRYRGKVKIFNPDKDKVFNTVGEMVKVFPRYVKTLDSFVSKDGKHIDRQTVLELDRIFPGEGLVCNRMDGDSEPEELIIGTDDRYRFALSPDDTEYTLEEVTNKFPFPQYVKFVGKGPKLLTSNIQEIVEHSKIFEGTVKIKNIVLMEMVIGHYKPPMNVSKDTEERCQRTLVMFPLDSPIAKELDVRLPQDIENDEEYELVMARNFSPKRTNEEEIDGTLYADFLKTPKAALVDYEEIDQPLTPQVRDPPPQDKPPPLPPKKPKAKDKPPPRPMKRSSSNKVYDYSYLDAKPRNVSTTKSPTVPLTKSPKFPLSRELSEDDEPDDDYEQIDESVHILTDDDKEKGYIGVQSKDTVIEKVPEKFKFSLRKVHVELIKLVKKKRKEDDSTGQHTERKTSIERTPSKCVSKECNTQEEGQSKSDSRKWFESLKPNDLYRHLTEIKLDKLAIACRDNELDGSFFNNLSDDAIKKSFNVTSIQILKFRRFQNDGWVPH
ncbi:uncharacterized protein [Argopecten irradians]|uniref:uncharacterized protein isoform X1 n=1 Tax=Argopecten irradians TaxID=31199 RepID=UPI0037101D08